jgi:hypothetical protein
MDPAIHHCLREEPEAECREVAASSLRRWPIGVGKVGRYLAHLALTFFSPSDEVDSKQTGKQSRCREKRGAKVVLHGLFPPVGSCPAAAEVCIHTRAFHINERAGLENTPDDCCVLFTTIYKSLGYSESLRSVSLPANYDSCDP